jgi:hypothetical protein
MYRVIVLYQEAPDADDYAAHAEVCKTVPGGEFGYGAVTGSPLGNAPHVLFAEWSFPDKASFDAAIRSEQFMESGKDAVARGLPAPVVQFVQPV